MRKPSKLLHYLETVGEVVLDDSQGVLLAQFRRDEVYPHLGRQLLNV